jgi:UDP-GlcNAc:undecaprenyl-phosphate GlcNAc-1-phosphate transferase
MHILVWLGLVALGLSLVLTPLFRNLFRICGFVDLPNQTRKIHAGPVPRAGGIAIATSYVASFFIVQLFAGIMNSQLALVWKVLPSAAVIFVVGFIDDLFGLKHWQKLIGQVIAAGVACWSGILVLDVVGVHSHAWWSIPATVLWLLACTNAFNLVDGMDGLAAGVGLFSTLTIFVAALLQQNMALAMATAALAGCLLGFLRYNFNPATTFLGDSGSLLIGFVLGCYGIIWVQKSATFLGMTAPIMALSLPLFDVTLAIARRFLRTQSIFSADRGHIHHRLLDRGISPRKAVLLLYGLSSIVAVFSLLQGFSHSNQVASVVVIVFCAVAWMGIQYLEYVEFKLAGRFLFRGDLQKTVKAHIELDVFRNALGNLETPEECFHLVAQISPKFGFRLVNGQIVGDCYAKRGMHSFSSWTVRIPMQAGDFLELERADNAKGSSASAGPFVDTLRTEIIAKCHSFRSTRSVASLAFGA